jgi:RNA polymerase sigma-70 factor (ECF subfamily)
VRLTVGRDYANAPDADLIRWSSHGDRRAFDEVMTRHGPFALRLAARLVPGAAAEDVAQESMLRAWRQAGRFDPRRGRFTTWLYRIVVNLCLDHRRQSTTESLPEGWEQEDPLAASDQLVMARDVRRALAALPARQRAALALVYDEDMSGAEAARVLGTSAKAVERLLARGRATLREKLMPKE